MAKTIHIKMLDEEVEIDLTNNMLTLSTARSSFLLPSDTPVSLSFVDNGHEKRCTVTDTNSGPSFVLPDEWPSKLFTVHTKISSPTSSNPYYPIVPPETAPTSEAFLHWMFYLKDEYGKSCTICIHSRFFVTFRHGSHSLYNIGDELTLYRAKEENNDNVGVKVFVVTIDEGLDFVILKSEFDVVEKGPPIARIKENEPYTLCGFGNELNCMPGMVHTVTDFYFTGAAQRRFGPYILGTSRSTSGDSGGAIWGARGLLGMNTGCTTMPVKNIICPASYFKKAYLDDLQKERNEENMASPPKKKPCMTTEIEGLGTFYGSSE